MNTTSYDTSRLFTTESGPECIDTCPKCDCDGRYVGDTWLVPFQEWSSISTDSRIFCASCECKLDDNGNKYAYCEFDSGYGAGEFTETCSNTIANENQYVCHEDDSDFFDFSGKLVYIQIYFILNYFIFYVQQKQNKNKSCRICW